jgi:branched-chain amino acid transport system ATP-binding protein
MSAILSVSGLKAWYGLTQALHGIDFQVADGGITALLGANGAGKTTTLRGVCGMVKTTGTIEFAGAPIQGKSTEDVARLGIAHAVEGRGTFVNLSVEENLQLGAYGRRSRAGVNEDIERAFTYFPVLKQRRTQQAGTLSGGEQQMLAISRALMLRPKLLLLDEPSFGLAPLIVEEIFGIMRGINREAQVSMLLVEQNASLALELADHAYLLETGRLVMSGPVAEFRKNDAIRRSYLGY